MHMLSKMNFNSVLTHEEATMYAHDLDLIVTVQLLEYTLSVLSFGTLCEEHSSSHDWASGQKPHQTKNGKRMLCKLSESSKNTKWRYVLSARPRRPIQKPETKIPDEDNSQATRGRLRDLPEQSEEFTDDVEDTDVPALQFGTYYERDIQEAWYLYSLPDRPKLRRRKRTEMTRAPCRRRTG